MPRDGISLAGAGSGPRTTTGAPSHVNCAMPGSRSRALPCLPATERAAPSPEAGGGGRLMFKFAAGVERCLLNFAQAVPIPGPHRHQ